MPPRDPDGPARARCPDCRRPRPCGCDSAEWRREQAATRFARERGESIPASTAKKPLGGALERNDRGDPLDAARRHEQHREEYASLRAHLELVELRHRQARKVAAMLPAELRRLEIEERVLRLVLYEGARLEDVSRALGRKSHSYASELFATIRAEAEGRGVSRGVVAVACACRRVGCVVVQPLGAGRPRRWRFEKCREGARAATRAARKRRRRARVRGIRGDVSGESEGRGVVLEWRGRATG